MSFEEENIFYENLYWCSEIKKRSLFLLIFSDDIISDISISEVQ